MIALKGHFDGKAIVPDEPVDLPRDKSLIVHVEVAPQSTPVKMISALELAGDLVGSATADADLSTNPKHMQGYGE